MKAIDHKSLNNNRVKRLLSSPKLKHRSLSKFVAAATGAALCSLSSVVNSLGLGEIQSTTYIGQPLNASIELVSVGGDVSVDDLIVKQVSAIEAEDLGAELTSYGHMLEFKIKTNQGIPYISVTSRNPIKEPYLNLLVELRWPNGVVYREYPVLLDPPPKAPVIASKTVNASQSRPLPAVAEEQKSSSKPVVGARKQEKLSQISSVEDKYRVKPGDTLSKIAERLREGTDRGIYDTMQWLYENNLHAFTNQNIDLLRAGEVLEMPDLSAYSIDNEVPTQEEQAKALQIKEPSADQSKPETAEELDNKFNENSANAKTAQNAASKGLLTVGTVNQDDSTRELIDMLVRENESLRGRMEKIEDSEYLDTLKQLIVLQRKEISDLRERIGVSDAENNDKISALLKKIDQSDESAEAKPLNDSLEVVVDDSQPTDEEQLVASEVELASENVAAKEVDSQELAPVKVDPVLSAPVMASKEDKNSLYWIILVGAAGIVALFTILLVYFRRSEGNEETELPVVTDEAYDDEEEEVEDTQIRPAITQVHHRVPQEPEEPTEEQTPELDQNTVDFTDEIVTLTRPHKESEDTWMGESAEVTENDLVDMDAAMREVQEAFDDLSLDESVLDDFNREAMLENMTEELKTQDGKNGLKPRTDDEVRLAIAEKMAQYDPEEYRKEIEHLGMLELDELSEFDEEHDEIDTTIYRAMMFCEFKKFVKARDLIQTKLDEGTEDQRLLDALEQIDSVEASMNGDSKQAG